MDQIIALAQKELQEQLNVLSTLEQDKEFALNEALKLQSEIPEQKAKIESLNRSLKDLYERYGYPGGQSGCASVSPAMPEVNKGVKPMQGVKKSASVNKNDILRAVNELSFSDYASALRAINDLNDNL